MNFKLFILSFFTSILLFGCNNDDDSLKTNLAISEIPVEITDFIALHFPDTPIVDAVVKNKRGVMSYDILLEGHLELEFNENFEIVEIDGHTKLPDSVIPMPVLEYVNLHYPDNVITDWERKKSTQEVGLDNNVDLIFDLDGNFIKVDND